MTNEQAKQEAIKKAYGDLYSTFKKREAIDKDGYVNWGNAFIQDISTHPEQLGFNPEKDIQWNGTKWRPKSLSGIYDNNGWIRIEPDVSNLPTTGNNFKVIFFDGKISDENQNLETINSLFKAGLITHYKPIEPELKPIY